MNISYNWLKRYIALNDSAEEVAKILTSIGLEVGKVEKVQTIKGGLATKSQIFAAYSSFQVALKPPPRNTMMLPAASKKELKFGFYKF